MLANILESRRKEQHPTEEPEMRHTFRRWITTARRSTQLLTAALTTLATAVRRTAATHGYSTTQADSAQELIEDGGLQPLRGRVWSAVSTDGQAIHRCTDAACSCPAGVAGRRCYHSLAVLALAA